ncbi:restriction endonuclease subunit S [Marinobacter sp. CHS3-4]|uniref:restriction endonuclease subunit S n=1 Tax=Marinobacter sp. CHS3-4 TaxID=3045174 RepID=UPI0024B4EE22|nr:restriction endonuclease subunit S [Marinobacter sp. CHS3-4]MDI9244542.1 restriction endonuclease subunit S [Marinobacter sp. CHS3-4]
MENDWREITLGEFVTLQRGHDLPESQRNPGHVPILGSFGITGWHSEARTKGPGVTIGRSGGSIGVVSYTPYDYWPLNTALYVKDFHGNDAKFAYYFLKTIDFKSYNSGSAQPSLNRNHVHPLPVKVPSPETQKVIAGILSELDDKIALNHQINTTLESMAQALFKSWFVDFDPVIDNALAAGNPIPEALQARADARAALGDQRKLLPDHIRQQFPDRFELTEEMGWVPEGWHISTIGEEVETTGGGTPSTKNPDFWENGTHSFCTPKDMSQLKSLVLMDTERHLTDTGIRKISSGQLPQGTVLMSSRAPIGYLAISDIPVSVNQGIIAMLPNQNYGPVYLLSWAKTNMNHIADRANGSTFQEISKKNFRPIPFLVPGKGILEAFNEQAEAIYSRILLTSEQTDALTKLRDTLLPKLLSGELRIPDAEEAVSEAL